MGSLWDERDWGRVSATARQAALHGGWDAVARSARTVLRTYSTSFFLVTRFLPPGKRAEVEVVYAAVRYPDEVVDTFPLAAEEKHARLDAWAMDYEKGAACGDFRESLMCGCSPFAAAFAEVVRRRGIPVEYYRAFIGAMRLDVDPRRYGTMDDLIESYVYGSAIVVGYFLAYIYGASRADGFERALASARNLGIALQLTNFLRDVGEDRRRGRVYLPCDLLEAEGLEDIDGHGRGQAAALGRVLRRVSAIAEAYYSLAECDVDAFAEDSRVAIRACIDVYRRLNLRIGNSERGVQHREAVPMVEKFGALPVSKYWRLPMAYAGLL